MLSDFNEIPNLQPVQPGILWKWLSITRNIEREYCHELDIVNFEHISHVVLVFPLLTWRRLGIFIVNFEYISHLVLVFLLLTLNR